MKTLDVIRATDTAAAAAWLTQVGDPTWRDWNMYWPTALEYGRKDPHAAIDWVLSLPKFPDEPVPPGLGAILRGWQQRDPASAYAWVMENTEQPWWPRAVNGLIDGMSDQGQRQQMLDSFSPETRRLIEQDRARPKPLATQAQ